MSIFCRKYADAGTGKGFGKADLLVSRYRLAYVQRRLGVLMWDLSVGAPNLPRTVSRVIGGAVFTYSGSRWLTFSPILPYQVFQIVYAQVDWIVSLHANISLLQILLVQLVRMP